MGSRLWLFLRPVCLVLAVLILIPIVLFILMCSVVRDAIRDILGLQTKGLNKTASLFTALAIPFDEAIPSVALFFG
jgi:hypothetical protein